MQMPETYVLILRLVLAGVLGGLIGAEREYRAKTAGTRTHILVAIGAALMLIVSRWGFDGQGDPARVAAQIVSGIGFLGAGAIIVERHSVHGLTTAAGIWVSAGIGMAVASGLYAVSVAATILSLIGLEVLGWFFRNGKTPCVAAAVLGLSASCWAGPILLGVSGDVSRQTVIAEGGKTLPKGCQGHPAKDWTKEPGAVVIEWRDGAPEVCRCEGYADIAARKPMTRDALFWAASNTKAVGAVLLLTFVDEGKVDLDAPVERYFPQWSKIEVVTRAPGQPETRRKPRTKPTVRQVLSHTSGLGFFPEMPIDRYSVRELVDIAVAKGLESEPGTKFTYSNWGIDIGVAIAEKVGGKPWEVLLRERILAPLEMNGATFWPTEEEQKRIVVPYHFPKDGGAPVRGNGVTQFNRGVALTDRNVRHAEAGGGLYATADDFIRFFAMLARKGVGLNGRRILSERACGELYRRQTPSTVSQAYSFGLFVDEKLGVVSHGGAYGTSGRADCQKKTASVRFIQVN